MTIVLWLCTYLLHSTVLYGIVLVCRRPLRQVQGAEIIWRLAVLLPLVSASAVMATGTGWTLGIPASPPVPSEAMAASSSTSSGTLTWLIAAGIAVGFLLLARDVIAHQVFLHHVGRRVLIPAELRSEICRSLACGEATRSVLITMSPFAVTPFVAGRAEICVPVRALWELTPRQLRALVAHEMAHIKRGDRVWFALFAAIERLLFIQPLTRIARNELRHLAEVACDAWAAHAVSDPAALAECLVEVAGWSRASPPAIVIGATGRGGLTDRVKRLLDAPQRPIRVSRTLVMTALAVVSFSLPGFTLQDPLRPADGAALVLPAGFGPRSAEFVRGYEAGRRFAQGQPDANLEELLARGRGRPAPPGQEWRADLERRLQAQRESR